MNRTNNAVADLAAISSAGNAGAALAGRGALTPEGLEEVKTWLADEQFQRLLSSLYKQGPVMMVPFTVGTLGERILSEQPTRVSLLIINTGTANDLFVGTGFIPSSANGLPIDINKGFWEPLYVPTQAIYIAGAGAGSTGLCVYATIN